MVNANGRASALVRRGAEALAVLLVLGSLAGCAGDGGASLKTGGGEASTSTADELWELAKLRDPGLEETDRPEVRIVREVDAEEFEKIMILCLKEEGFPEVQISADGETFDPGPSSPEHTRAFGLAVYMCATSYPIRG